ncbi:unnamed protein product [Rotaria sp. Silwood2]|nr:unnamed protein product [Rotaria sp. Silwood2]CAF4609002.1 unnamed protein product [Rotaria sp. Silwood2]
MLSAQKRFISLSAIFSHLFGKLNQSIIAEYDYSLDDNQICILYIASNGDYTQLPIIQSDPLRLGAYSPCPYLTSIQLSYIRRRIVERTLRSNYNQIYLLDYSSTFKESKAEILLSLYESDILLQYELDSLLVSILLLINYQTDVNVNNNGTSETNSTTINGERIFNVLGCSSTLQEAQIQSILACEYIKWHANIDDLLF